MMRRVLAASLWALAALHPSPVVADDPPSFLTTNAGAPVDDARNAQTLGVDGPILLQDTLLLERLQIHNRERIPERNVHARGAVAKGRFTATADWSNLTMASVFGEAGKTTEVACRWSTVIHGAASPEFLRDPRGFAIKFYTDEGNLDVVGLNFPVFFIRDGLRFPEMIRSLKPNPVTGVQEWWRVWDLFASYPESAHMFTWLLDDVGIPASYRELDGWGVHTFVWVNKDGKETWVRYVLRSNQGVVSLDDADAAQQSFSFATTDLYDAIDGGDFPSWNVSVQLLDPSDESLLQSLDFDPLDTTKQWPEDVLPPHDLGVLEFDQNVQSQFLENEQIAFSPGRLVPGIEASDEKMLQARIFAYADTQRYRLGVNNQLLPINRPRCPFRDQHVDGTMNFLDAAADSTLSNTEINYFPSYGNDVTEAAGFAHSTRQYTGSKVRQMINLTNDFAQPGDRYRSFDDDRQSRFATRVASTLSGERLRSDVLETWLGYWAQVDQGLHDAIVADLDALKRHDAAAEDARHKLLASDPRTASVVDRRRAFFLASGSRA